mmetsp:Transcript_37486/g.120491  ORF Transcript_37486/g.120491 Transcript_37486/m.120491 type:complete len:621 (+) Transcript_37486:1410-3272(+)
MMEVRSASRRCREWTRTLSSNRRAARRHEVRPWGWTDPSRHRASGQSGGAGTARLEMSGDASIGVSFTWTGRCSRTVPRVTTQTDARGAPFALRRPICSISEAEMRRKAPISNNLRVRVGASTKKPRYDRDRHEPTRRSGSRDSVSDRDESRGQHSSRAPAAPVVKVTPGGGAAPCRAPASPRESRTPRRKRGRDGRVDAEPRVATASSSCTFGSSETISSPASTMAKVVSSSNAATGSARKEASRDATGSTVVFGGSSMSVARRQRVSKAEGGRAASTGSSCSSRKCCRADRSRVDTSSCRSSVLCSTRTVAPDLEVSSNHRAAASRAWEACEAQDMQEPGGEGDREAAAASEGSTSTSHNTVQGGRDVRCVPTTSPAGGGSPGPPSTAPTPRPTPPPRSGATAAGPFAASASARRVIARVGCRCTGCVASFGRGAASVLPAPSVSTVASPDSIRISHSPWLALRLAPAGNRQTLIQPSAEAARSAASVACSAPNGRAPPRRALVSALSRDGSSPAAAAAAPAGGGGAPDAAVAPHESMEPRDGALNRPGSEVDRPPVRGRFTSGDGGATRSVCAPTSALSIRRCMPSRSQPDRPHCWIRVSIVARRERPKTLRPCSCT